MQTRLTSWKIPVYSRCHVIWQEGRLQLNSITAFHTGSQTQRQHLNNMMELTETMFARFLSLVLKNSFCENIQKNKTINQIISKRWKVSVGCVARLCVCVLCIFKWAETMYSNSKCHKCCFVRILLVKVYELKYPFTYVLSAFIQSQLLDHDCHRSGSSNRLYRKSCS